MKKHTLYAVFFLLLLSGCSKTPKFKVEGEINNAGGKMVYFELFGMNTTQVLDSVKLNDNGKFHFSTNVPKAPEFYRLRIDKRFIHLCADSARTVVIKAEGDEFGKNYSVEGSELSTKLKDFAALKYPSLVFCCIKPEIVESRI